jgi:hypothetical protein
VARSEQLFRRDVDKRQQIVITEQNGGYRVPAAKS